MKGKDFVPDGNQSRHDSVNAELLAPHKSNDLNAKSKTSMSINKSQAAVTDSLKNITISSNNDVGNNSIPEAENLSKIPEKQKATSKTLLIDKHSKIPSSEDNKFSAIENNIVTKIDQENSNVKKSNLKSSNSSKQAKKLNLLASDVASNIALDKKAELNVNDNDDNSTAEKSEHIVHDNKCTDENIVAFDFEIRYDAY